jgi:regulator of sirC expression with transglutaminase-like and TPR domain
MCPTIPLCCTPESFRLMMAQVSSLDSSDALVNGAVAIAMLQMDNADPAKVDETLQRFTDTVRSRVRGDQPQALLAHLHQFLFEEEGFAGNSEDFYNPLNSYLPMVLETKLGLPITLSLIYKVIAERLGVPAWGVALPGHFVVGVESQGGEMLIDPFSAGQLILPEEARSRLSEVYGPEMEWSEEFLQPVSNRHWLTRMLQNLLHVFGSAGQYGEVAAVLELEMLLWPDQDRLQRDLALVLARIGMAQPASAWLDRYLKNNPDDPQRRDLVQLLDVLSM